MPFPVSAHTRMLLALATRSHSPIGRHRVSLPRASQTTNPQTPVDDSGLLRATMVFRQWQDIAGKILPAGRMDEGNGQKHRHF